MTFRWVVGMIPAMFDKLPNWIDPIYSAQHNKYYDARVKQDLFPRLKEQTLSQDKMVEVSIQFYYDKLLRFPAFKMSLKTTFVLECQRSLEPFEFETEISVNGVFVETLTLVEEVPNNVEIYELEGLENDKLSLVTLIEDELLLSIPLAPINDCAEMAYENSPEEVLSSTEAHKELKTKKSPFAALKGLNK